MDTNPVIGVTLLCQGIPCRPASQAGSQSAGAKRMKVARRRARGPSKSSSGSCAMHSWLPPAVQRSPTARVRSAIAGPRLLLQGAGAYLGLQANGVDPHAASVV
jgi:hypothetical protein